MAESIVATPQFCGAVLKFPAEEQDRIWKAVRLISTDPGSGGLNPERLHGKQAYWSFRASQGVRIIATRAEGYCYLLGVDRHDQAYKRAEAGTYGKPTVAARPDVAAPIDFSAFAPEKVQSIRGPLEHIADERLEREFGVPEDWIGTLRSLREVDQLIDIGLEDALTEAQFFGLMELFPKPSPVSTGANPVYRLPSEAIARALARGEVRDLQFNLPASSWAIIEMARRAPILVKGGPGSGKTLVALYRALHVLEEDIGLDLLATPSVLYVTYTNQLCEDAVEKVERLRGAVPAGLTIATYDSIARRLGAAGAQIKFKSEELRPFADDAVRGTGIDAAFFLSEVESLIEFRNVRSLEDYQRLQRRGRGAALGQAGRARVWRAYETYLGLLADAGAADLGTVRMRACDASVALPDTEKYDFVIVDEVQDLPMSTLQMVANLTKGDGRAKHLMLVGDAGQAIHSRGFRWSDVGLRIGGGNVYSLVQSERSTQQILDFAKALFDAPAGLLSDDIEKAVSSKSGPRPRIIDGLVNDDAVYEWIVADVRARIESGVAPEAIAVIAHSGNKLAAIASELKDAGFETVEYRQQNFYRPGTIKLIVAQSSKGLEFAEVYIPDAGDGIYPFFKNKNIDDAEDRADSDVQDCQLLYVAATRAGDRLTVIYSREISPFVENARALAESL